MIKFNVKGVFNQKNTVQNANQYFLYEIEQDKKTLTTSSFTGEQVSTFLKSVNCSFLFYYVCHFNLFCNIQVGIKGGLVFIFLRHFFRHPKLSPLSTFKKELIFFFIYTNCLLRPMRGFQSANISTQKQRNQYKTLEL